MNRSRFMLRVLLVRGVMRTPHHHPCGVLDNTAKTSSDGLGTFEDNYLVPFLRNA